MAKTATAPTTTDVTVALATDLLSDVDDLVRADSRTRDDVIDIAVRFYLSERRWREAQAVVSVHGSAAGIRTEDDVEELIDSLPD